MKHRHSQSQHGQAMPEFVVALLVLVPMFVIVPKIAQYIEVAQVTTVATRFAGFETSMYHQIRGFSIDSNFNFANDGGFDHKSTGKVTGSLEEDEKEMTKKIDEYFYKDNRSAKALVKKMEVTREYENEQRYLQNYNTNVRHSYTMEKYTGAWGLANNEYRVAQIKVDLVDLPWKADVLGPTDMTRYIVIPFYGWAARGPNDHKVRLLEQGVHYPRPLVRRHTNDGYGTMIVGVLGAIGTSYTMGGKSMPLSLNALMQMESHTVKATGFNGGELWEIDVENVPEDRLR